MPVAVDPKSARPCVSVCHGDGFTTVECHRVPQAAQPSATRPWKGPRATRGPMSWSAGTQRRLPPASALPGSRSCRARKLVAPRVLPGRRARRGMSSEMQSSGLPGKLFLPGSCINAIILSLGRPSRQAPLAGALIFCLVYFVFEWFYRDQKGLRRARGEPCRGKLLLPVHKLGY